MLLCSCRKMCTFAAKIAQNRFNAHEFRIYIAPFPAYLLAILSMAISEWRESAGHCRCAIHELAKMAVSPDAQSKGIGRQLGEAYERCDILMELVL